MAEIVSNSEIQWVTGGSGQARGTSAQQRWLFQGDPASPDNYEFAHVRLTNDTQFSPRHRHNFDQFRFALKGPANHSPGQDILEGQLGYFPEGAYYGPQKLANGSEFLVLQFGGASEFGFMSYADHRRAYAELAKVGSFEKGIYTSLDAEGKRHNTDGHQAMWEFINRRPITFPKPRVAYPVVIDPDACLWVAMPEQPGVSSKHLGTFNERGTFGSMIRIEAGAACRFDPAPQTRLLYVLRGAGAINSAPVEAAHAARIVKGDPASVVAARTEIHLLVLGLPRFDAALQSQAA